jgi:hypothetical protein
MASDNAAYQGRLPQTSGNKRSLLSNEGAGASKATKRQLERVASFSRVSCNSAPALLQGTGGGHEGSRRLRSSSSDWASNSDDAWAEEEEDDKGMSESPSASYGSAAQEELPKAKPRGRKAQQQGAALQQQQQDHQNLQMAFAQHGYNNEWNSNCSPALAQLDALHLLHKAAGQEVSSAGMLQASAAKPAGEKAGKGRCRLGQPEMHSGGATASKLHSNTGYAAAAGMLPKWQLAAGFPQMPQPGVQPGSVPAGWFSAAAMMAQQQHYQQQQQGHQQQQNPQQQQQQGHQQQQQQAVMQEPQSTGMSASGWQHGPSTGGQAQHQPNMVPATTQGFPAASMPASWQADFHAAARRQLLSPQGASSMPTAWQGGFSAGGAAQRGAPVSTQGFPAASMPANWQGKAPVLRQQAAYRGSPCSESDFQPPQRTHSMPAGPQFPGLQHAALASHNSADPTSIMQAARQAQLSPSGMTHWPAVCQAAMAPALPVRVKVQDMPAQTYWSPDKAPSPAAHIAPAAEQHLQGVLGQYGARQALALAQHILGSNNQQHHESTASGVGSASMHPHQDPPAQTYTAQGPPAAEMRGQHQQQQGADPDWLDVLTCTEGPETCESGYKPGAGTAGTAAAASAAGRRESASGELTSGAAAAGQASTGAAFGSGPGAARLSCISPEFNLLQSCLMDPDAVDADLPSDEIDALLDQALEDLFTAQPQVVLAMCRAEGSTLTVSDATAAPAGPCTSTARNEPL